MAVNFPDSPANGDSFSVNDTTYVYNATAGYWDITSTVQASASTGTNAPSNPSSGDLWFDPSSLTTYIYYSDGTSSQWVPANSVGARGAPGPGYPTAYYSVDYTSTATGNVVFNSSSSPTLPSYTVGKINAWVNGVLRSDIGASDGSNVEISLSTGDEVQIINFGDTDILDPTASSNDHTTYTTLSSLIDTVQANVTSAGSGVAVYATPDLLPLSGTNAGEQAYVNSTNRLYINNGTGWYSIGLVNSSPSITSVLDGDSNTTPFTLSTDGSASIITITATDPEDIPLTYTYSVTSGSLSNGGGTTATVVQGTGSNTNKFTVTPSTTEAYAGTFSLTFTASDGINTATSANSFTLEFITIVTNSKYTTLLATAAGTSVNNIVTDSSSSNHSITISGSNDIRSGTFSPYRSGGYSLSLNGTDESFEPNHSSASGLGTTWSVSYWAYIPSSGATNLYPYIFDFDRNNTSGNGFALQANLSFKNFSLTIATYGSIINTATNLTCFDKWSYYVITHSSGTTTFYIDGSSVGSSTNSNMASVSAAPVQQLVIGGDRYDQSGMYTKMDVRDFHVRSEAHNGAVNNEAAVADSNTVVLAAHKPYLASQTGASTALTPVINNDVSTKPFSPYDYDEYSAADHGGSILLGRDGYTFGGSTRLDIASSSDFAFGTGDYTIECWARPQLSESGYQSFLLDFNTVGTLRLNDGVFKYTSAAYPVTNPTPELYNTGSGPVPVNVWSFLSISRHSGVTRMFLNGVMKSKSGTTSGDGGDFGSASVRIGARASNNSDKWNGEISDLRIIKGTSLYQSDSSFTPPTSPLTAVTNTKLLLKGTDASIIDKSQGSNLKLVGDTTGSTAQAKFANTKSMYFDGTGDYIRINDNKNILNNLINNDELMTIEAWVYPTISRSGGNSYLSPSILSIGNTYLSIGLESLTPFFYWWTGSGNTISSSNAITLNAWSHIAVVLGANTGSNNIKIYVNGNLDGQGTFSGISWATSAEGDQVKVGEGNAPNANSYFQGYIEDLRITDGLARYTANFTPPTASLEG